MADDEMDLAGFGCRVNFRQSVDDKIRLALIVSAEPKHVVAIEVEERCQPRVIGPDSGRPGDQVWRGFTAVAVDPDTR